MSPESVPSVGVISMTYARPFTERHLDLFPRMRRAGLDFCELLVPEEGELDHAAARRAAEKAGLFLVLAARVNAARDIASPDPDSRRAGVAYLRRCVDVAVACGASLVGGPLFGAPLVFAGRVPAPLAESDRRTRNDRVVAGLREAARHAEVHGVRLAIEPLNRFETDLCTTAAHAAELADAVGSAALGVMLDTFHMNMEEDDLPAAIRLVGPRLIHFQANENHRGFLGSGHIDWPPICRALAEIGYRGPITLEPFRRTETPLGTPLAQWRPPLRDEDADLAHSVAFLRAALHAARRA